MNMNELLFRGSQEIIVEKELKEKLASGDKLRIKYGIDPTGSRIHIGHAATMRKLKHFQDEGHQIVLIIGSFTGRIGDASDKDSERTLLSSEEVKANMKGYEAQLGRIFDLEETEFHYNHEWFEKMSLDEWLRINQLFSVAQLIERDNFSKRFASGSRIGLQEFQYPLLQGYDSVAVEADVEIGGSDQLFNLLAGRTLQKSYGQNPQNIITYELLQADDGRKMSKSWANCIWIDDEPNDMYGKVMRINDELIMHYFELCSDLTNAELDEIKVQLKKDNPKVVKSRLAREIVSIYYDEATAFAAEEAFSSQFVKGELPENIEEMTLKKAEWNLVDLLAETGLAASKKEANRLISQGGVKINSQKTDESEVILSSGDVVQAGKRRFVKINLA